MTENIEDLVAEAQRLALIDRISREPVVAMLGRVATAAFNEIRELRAVIAEALEAATHTMHPEQLPTRCGVCRIERILSRIPEHDDKEQA